MFRLCYARCAVVVFRLCYARVAVVVFAHPYPGMSVHVRSGGVRSLSGGDPDEEGGGVGARVLSTLLNEMDGVGGA